MKCQTDYKRVLNRGKSFECSIWQPLVNYTNDCLKQDFVTIGDALFVCLQSHISSEENKPMLVYDDSNNYHKPTGTNSPYWGYVLSGFSEWDKLSEDIQSQILKNIEGLDTPDSEVIGEYVSSVMQEDAKLRIKRAPLPSANINTTNDFFELGIVQKQGAVTKVNVDIKNIAKKSELEELTEKVSTLENLPSLVEINYFNLKILRNNGRLIPGTWYRITDYQTTTNKANTQAAGHQFDVIVLATDNNNLSHCARAIKHEGDTYFKNSNLNAWQLWYDLDNDVLKYDWAGASNQIFVKVSADYMPQLYHGIFRVIILSENEQIENSRIIYNAQPCTGVDLYCTENGKCYDESWNFVGTWKILYPTGIIYKMIDERENECPYDFKNIQFNPYHANKLKLGAAGYYTFSGLEDAEVIEISTHNFFNAKKPSEVHHNKIDIDITDSSFTKHIQPLYRNVFITKDKAYIKYNKIHAYCYDNTFFTPNLSYCTFDYGCMRNLINNVNNSNIHFSVYCEDNEILADCFSLYLGYNSNKNIFENKVLNCNLTYNCNNNAFKDIIQNVALGPGSENNTFMEMLYTFSTGEHFDDNTVGKGSSVRFGAYCTNNNFGRLQSVIGGGYIIGNNIPIDIVYTNIGNNVRYCNSQIENAGTDIIPKIINSTIKNGTIYTDFIFTENLHTMKYSIILCRGSEDVRKKVYCQIIDNDYQVNITQNSSGEVKQYCEADLIA